jgi:nucleotide-binding universal stress UspA family protein
MLDTVLFAVDFGEYQPLALPCLKRLKNAGCRELVLLHVMNERRSLRDVPVLLRGGVASCYRKMVEQKLDEFARTCGQEGLKVRSIVARADLQWIELCDIASREAASLLVLGPRVGKDPGPTSYFVLHDAASSLLILKIPESPGQELYGGWCRELFVRPLLPTDWSECALRAERYAATLGNAGAREVILAHVTEGGLTEERRGQYMAHAQRRMEHSRRTLEDAGLKVRRLLLEGDPSLAIADAAERENASVIIMGSTGKTVTEERLVGSVSERVALVSSRSVLLVH